MVNRVGDEIQLVRFGPDYRALAEIVPPEDAGDVQGWIRTAERTWRLSGHMWQFEERGRLHADG